VLSPSIPQLVYVLGVEEKVHLLANMAAFAPPRYTTLPSESLATLLHLLAAVMSTLPSGMLELKSSTAVGKRVADSEGDSDSEDSAHISASSAPPVPLTRVDERTLNRLQTLPAATHITSLIRSTQSHTEGRIALYDFLFAVCSAWPLPLDSILSTIVVSTGGGFVRELYRGYVRGSPLGKEVSLATILGMSLPFYSIAHPLTQSQTLLMRTLGSPFFS
jgi:ubiquitin-protein ligase E3 C